MSNPNRRRSPWGNGHFCTHIAHSLHHQRKCKRMEKNIRKLTVASAAVLLVPTTRTHSHCLLSILKFRRSRATKPTFLQIPARLRSNGLLLSIVQNKGVKLQSRFFTYLKNHHLMVFSHHLRLVFSKKISVRQPMRGLFRSQIEQ